MLPRLNRLTKKRDYQEIYRRGRSVGGQFLLVKIKPNQFGRARVGIVVSKRAAPKAVQRSKIKRQLRHIIRPDVISGESSYDLAVVLKKGFSIPTYKNLLDDWHLIWPQIKK